MMHSLFHNTFLAARGDKDLFDILIPLAIAAIYAIVSILRKRSEKQQGGGSAQKQRSRPLDRLRPQQHARPHPSDALSNPAAARQAAQREYDAAKELARRQFEARMQRIREYEQNRPMGVSDAVWKKQIDGARKTVRLEYEDAQQQARDEYLRVAGRWPEQPAPPARKAPKPQPKQPVAGPSGAEPFKPAPVHAARQAEALEALAYHLSFSKDDLTRGILYSEILGKPLALREDA
jgi:hypothetical protein